MKKKIIVVLLLSVLFTLAACSSAQKEGLNVTDDNKAYLEEYDKSLQTYIMDMASILKTFNDSLDGIYTKKMSKEQFSQVITKAITDSNELVASVDALEVKPELFEAHQSLILLINRSHQLLLDAVDMANDNDRNIEKEVLRNDYLDIKTEQAELANQWKILREELEGIEE